MSTLMFGKLALYHKQFWLYDLTEKQNTDRSGDATQRRRSFLGRRQFENSFLVMLALAFLLLRNGTALPAIRTIPWA